MKTTVVDKDQVLPLIGALDIGQADSVRLALLDYTGKNPAGILDLSGVTQCDAAGAQLLWAAQRSAAATGGAIRFVAVPPAVHICWERLGLDPAFFTTSTFKEGNEQDDSNG